MVTMFEPCIACEDEQYNAQEYDPDLFCARCYERWEQEVGHRELNERKW